MSAYGLLSLPRLVWQLNRFLGAHLTAEQCRAIVRQRLETRDERFLQFVGQYVYGYQQSPYLQLLRHAGCEYGDLVAMVRQRGLERTLQQLRDDGVYAAFEEFKGQTTAVRGGRTFRFSQRDFDNPFRGARLRVMTGATRSRGAPVFVALKTISENRAICFSLMLEAAGVGEAPLVTWLPGFPSGSGFFLWLGLAHIGRPPLHWCAMTDPNRPSVTWHQRGVLPLARIIGRRHGLNLPLPEFVPLSSPEIVLESLLAIRMRHGSCALITTPSAAVRVASLARQRGESLAAVHMFVGSEPLTPGKAEDIVRTGATVHARYIFTEGGGIGVGCGNPSFPDEMHFMRDSFAMISHRRAIEGVGELDTFMFTSLLRSAPKVLLNVEIDDFGQVFRRSCGCILEQLGLHDHIAGVRSFTKLTGEGAKVLGTDCVRVLEEVLPKEFGGSSVDYQLLEAEDGDHVTRLFLLVNPDLPGIDEQRVLERFVQEMVRNPYSGVPYTWFQDQTIRVVRRRPVETAGGKLLPFHTQALQTMQTVVVRGQVASEAEESVRRR